MYDIIGDIHGHADELVRLLDRMGYARRGGVFAHPNRTAVFVGDFIDRGPQIAEVLRIARSMIENEAGLAVMGNHEFNAIAYHTPDPSNQGGFLREHTDKNTRQHAETLQQFTADELRDSVAWFGTLPMWLDLDGVRVVHACWDDASMATIEQAAHEHGPNTLDFMRSAADEGSPLFRAVENVLKGKELPLPAGVSFRDKDGHERSNVRVRWFEHPAGKSFAEYALPLSEEIPTDPIPEPVAATARPYGCAAPPVFFGHYWLKADQPARLAPNVACVDYSVAKGGQLCAYRWSGEAELDDRNFVCTDAAGRGD